MIVAIRDQVIILKEKEEEKKSQGGLFMPTTSASNKNVTGKVVQVGSGRVTMNGSVVPLDVKSGDKVLFNPNMATEADDEGNTYYVLREDNILAVWR